MSATKKNKNRINVIDVVIILLVLALVGTAAYRIYDEVTKNVSSRQSDCILTFECEVAYDSILNYLKSGDEVYLTKDGTLLGRLYDGTNDDGKGAVYKVTDEKTEENASNTVTLRGSIKLSIDARKAQGGEYYVINGTNITEGGELSVYTEKAEMKIVVKSLSESK